MSALGHSDKSSSHCAPSAQGGDRATSGKDEVGDTQGRQQDRGTTRDTDTQDKGQLRELLPQPAGNSPRLNLEKAKIHTHQRDWSRAGHLAGVFPGQGWATVLLWSFSGWAGEQWVRKETEKELTVPWMRAGVKDGAKAMEA